ncbi:MAG TPA: HAMP domain-containing sensor histidine kinase [Kofleriaceae bacterium]|nr:HAMP domain-containing sensor histidine kinase [Kofleriaceae bacterium]
MKLSSTRIRRLVVIVLAAIVLVPVGVVLAIDRLARTGREDIAEDTVLAARDAARSAPDEPALRALAARHQVEIWLVEPRVRVVFDSAEPVQFRSEMGFGSLGGMGYEDLVALDATRAPPYEREHVLLADRNGVSAGCTSFLADELYVCEAAVKTTARTVVLVERKAPRVASRLVDAHEGLLLLGGAVLVAGGLVAGWLVRRLTRPLAALDRQVAARARGEQQAIAIADAPREIAEVARAVDQLAAALEDRRRRDAEAAADLAHELKSPLARIKLALEAGTLDPEARGKLDDHARQAIVAIDRTIADLLAIARAEAGQLDEPREPTDLATLAAQVVATRPAPPGLAIAIVGEGSATIAPHAVARALGHLVDNAYAHARSRVTVEVGARAIAVVDDGPGVPAELRPQLFERFASRRPGGTGLGLAFVRAVARAHGGDARLDGSARFVIALAPIHTGSTNV